MNPKRLIEEWLPIKEIGVESRRERAASSALYPPLYFGSTFGWARRPANRIARRHPWIAAARLEGQRGTSTPALQQ